MATARIEEPTASSVLDLVRRSRVVAELAALFNAITHRAPQPDTSIAWEDGEVGETEGPKPHAVD
jgi:hypothetical protein